MLSGNSRFILWVGILAVTGAWSAPFIQAQSPVEPLAFEVASIKLSAMNGSRSLVQAFPGRLTMTTFSVRSLILFAYGIRDYQISGEPPWIGSSYYDIEAKAAGSTSVRQMEGPMLQTLLEDRFQLKLRREIRQFPSYSLVIAKSGAKLQQSKAGSCTPYLVDVPAPQSPAQGETHPIFCGFPHAGFDGLSRTLDGVGITMPGLANSLSRSELRRIVIDKTGLSGSFDVDLRWITDASPALTDGPDGPPRAADPAGSSIFGALEEQLGLKLEPAKAPAEVLVIDRISLPSAN